MIKSSGAFKVFMDIAKSERDKMDKLIEICLKLDDKYIKVKERTEGLQRMAQLARAGEKDTQEFKELESMYKNPTVVDSSDEYEELHKLMKKFRK